MNAQVRLAFEPIDPAALLHAFSHGLDGEGAVVTFCGYARGIAADGTTVSTLELETYRGVTLASMERIAADALDRFAVSQCTVVHRAGRIAPGEAIVFVAAASTHRRAAFDAADYLMDRLKTEAVFWKREEGPDGSSWIEPREGDHADAARWSERR